MLRVVVESVVSKYPGYIHLGFPIESAAASLVFHVMCEIN